MGIFDKAKDKAEQLIGEAKEKIGQMNVSSSTSAIRRCARWLGAMALACRSC